MSEVWFSAEYRYERPRPLWRRVVPGFVEVKEGTTRRYLTDAEFTIEFVVADGKVE
jgi:hypothetical protein